MGVRSFLVRPLLILLILLLSAGPPVFTGDLSTAPAEGFPPAAGPAMPASPGAAPAGKAAGGGPAAGIRLPLELPEADPAGAGGTDPGGGPPAASLEELRRAESREGAREKLTPERVLSALRLAYPARIEEVARRQGDWAVRVGGEWYFWANGRLLPERERPNWERYDPLPFYLYPRSLPPVPRLSEKEKARIAERLKGMEKKPPLRHSGFTDAIWRIHDRASSWERMKTTYFLGMKTEIHRDLLEDLAAVEEEILAGAERDPALKEFIKSLRRLSGYNWRRIDGTSSLSYHSYGAALDIIPASYGNRQTYWRWAMPNFPEWYSLPYRSRFMPPEAFVRAFERHGFVWGGKWLFFDTMHFEYRPEILILSGLPPVP